MLHLKLQLAEYTPKPPSPQIRRCTAVLWESATDRQVKVFFSSDIGTLSCSHCHTEEWQIHCFIASGESHSHKGPNAS